MTQRKKTPMTKLATAQGIAHFAYIDKPDSGREFSDDKYKVTISFDAADPFVKKLEDTVEKLLTEYYGDRRPRNLHHPVKDGDDTTIDSLQGRVFIRAKSSRQPMLVDAKNQPIPEGITVFSGDVIRAGITLAVFDGAQKGVTAYLDAVKIIEKRSGGSSEGGVAGLFGEDEGYSAPSAPVSTKDDSPFEDDDDL